MLFRNFLAWARTAPSEAREQAASALARAFLVSDLSVEERSDAEVAMTSLLDDPSPAVRRALAVELAASPDAPPHIIGALAGDQSEVSIPVLSRSPLLGEAELAEIAPIADVYAQAAIALRADLPPLVAWTLADRGEREAAISLAVNTSARVPDRAWLRLLERFGDDGEVREAVYLRTDTAGSVRSALTEETASALSAFVTSCGWMTADRAEKACREAREAGLVTIAAENAGESEPVPLDLVRFLRARSQLTPALLVRGLLSGNRSLFEAALAELSGLPVRKVRDFTAAWSGAGFGALYGRANLPAGLLPVFRAALAAQDEYGLIYTAGQTPRLSILLINSTLKSLQKMNGGDFSRVLAMLHRLKAEAARAEARAFSEKLEKAGTLPASASIPEIDLAALEAEIAAAA